MNVTARGLGYREVDRLADFMKAVADKGLGLEDDVAVAFSYSLKEDEAYCTTENGKIITGSDIAHPD